MYGGEATRAVNGSSWSFTESREGLEKALRKFAKQFVCWLWYLWTRVPISCIRAYCCTHEISRSAYPSVHLTSPGRRNVSQGGDWTQHMCPSAGCSHPLPAQSPLSWHAANTGPQPALWRVCDLKQLIATVTLWGGRGSSWRRDSEASLYNSSPSHQWTNHRVYQKKRPSHGAGVCRADKYSLFILW